MRAPAAGRPRCRPGRFEQSLERWFTATELYPRQLREVDRDTYFAMKRKEYQRQQATR
jgi:hypothetical protein